MAESPKILWINVPVSPRAPAAWTIQGAASAEEGIARHRRDWFDCVIVQAPVPQWSAEELVDELRQIQPDVPIVVQDIQAKTADTVRYVRRGAHDVAGPGDDLIALAEAAIELRRGQRSADATREPWRDLLIGSSRPMLRTIEIIRLVGCRRSTVLITGETGTGKERVARALHLASPRAQLPFVAVNCNALPENLLEAELFGHVKGAFTGAVGQRVGRFEQAHRGTLFLDEVGDLPLDIQTKLLRVLQEREFQRLGSSETIRVDVRLIAATNVNLAQHVREGKFREDLYYRLNVVPISTPALRDRRGDIPQLAHHFVEKICRLEEIPLRRLTPEALSALAEYTWPGNVRQLENSVEMAVALSGERDVLYPSDFPLPASIERPAARTDSSIAMPEHGINFEETVGALEREILTQALLKAGGNKTAAASMLGLKRTTLAAKLKSFEAFATN